MKTQDIRIIKKNGTKMEFDAEKIVNAIGKSAERAMRKLTQEQEQEVVRSVLHDCKEYMALHSTDVPVLEVHKMVEVALCSVEPDVAEAYRSYRNYKITFVGMMDNILKYQQEVLFLGDRSNANTDSALNTTQATLIGNETLKELYNEFFLTPEEQEACKQGGMYIHDKNRRLISTNCCLFDVKAVLEYGVEMSGLKYTEPKYLTSVLGIIKDIAMTAGSNQYGGLTVQSIDEIIAPYMEKAYQYHLQEAYDLIYDCVPNNEVLYIDELMIEKKAMDATMKELRQGLQQMEIAFNTLPSSRGDFVFVTYTFGLGQDKWSRMVAKEIMIVRNQGQGVAKIPQLFPKLVYLFDHELHAKDKPMRQDYEYAVYCQSQTMFPDLLSLTGHTTEDSIIDVYKKYGIATSPINKSVA